jgi:hypothetical protein
MAGAKHPLYNFGWIRARGPTRLGRQRKPLQRFPTQPLHNLLTAGRDHTGKHEPCRHPLSRSRLFRRTYRERC